LLLNGPLQDKVANSPNELEEGGVIFGKGFGVITDMQVGPEDRYLYVLTYDGTIYKIYIRLHEAQMIMFNQLG
jgi:aldose sugar dehydrogenase